MMKGESDMGEKIGTVRARERSLRNTVAELRETLERYQNQIRVAIDTIRGLMAIVDDLRAQLVAANADALDQARAMKGNPE